MGFLDSLDDFCADRNAADRAAMSDLSLTGLQPCFEDTVLVLPVYVCMAVLSVYRMNQCVSAGKFHRTFTELLPSILETILCIANLTITILTFVEMDNAARYQQLVYPFAMLGWFFLAFSNILQCFYFSYYGQWIHRFLYLWIFVSYSIRWPTQHALSKSPASFNEWRFYIIGWLCQAALLILMYLKQMILLDEIKIQQAQLVTQTAGADIELSDISLKAALFAESEKQSMSERLSLAASAVTDYDIRLNRTPAEEEKEMSPVHWTEILNPLGRAGIFSKITYSWMSPLMAYARKNAVEPTDVWDLQARFRSIDNFHSFEKIWLDEKAKHNSISDEIEKEKSHPLRSAIYRSFGKYHLLAGPLLLIQNLAQLGLPYLLKPLLNFLQAENIEPLLNGYLYSCGFFISLMIMTIAENQYFHRTQNTASLLRSSFVPTIFRHSLRLSNQARQERSVGAIVSHMSGDTDKIAMMCTTIHNLWSAPMRLTLGLIMLIYGLGVSGIVGFLFVICLVPIQMWVMKKMVGLNKQVMGKSDMRIKACNEVLAGMRVIKYYAWERPFQDKIDLLRKAELDKLLDVATWRALSSFFTSLNPVAMSCGTFIAFAIIQGNLSSPQAFQALTLFQQMIWPLFLFPSTISNYLDCLSSVDRIESFLLSSTVEDPLTLEKAITTGRMDQNGLPIEDSIVGQYLRVCDGQPDIQIQNGTYSWSDKSPATLVDINIKIETNSLVAIVGSTGSGKSSLISAIIGEMVMKFGKAKMGGSFAYAPQQAWIYNATVRDNILFGLDFNQEKYDRAINLSCLKKDIEKQFAAGDMTEIGEKGINMSGGQRQRLNIARALYANPDIIILDDPLSALDPHVGNEVFKNIKLLIDKTRIFATNQLHLASQFDRIIVVKDGRIIEDGTFAALKAKVGGEFHRLHDELGAVPEEEIASKGTKKSASAIDAVANDAKDVLVNTSAGGSSAAIANTTTKDIVHVHTLSVKQRRNSSNSSAARDAADTAAKDVGKLVKEEGHNTGSVSREVYMGYFRAIGWQATIFMFLGVVLANCCQLGTSMWLSHWAKAGNLPDAQAPAYYVGIYTLLSFCQIFIAFFANWSGYFGSVRGSAKMHSSFMNGLMMSPIRFFDSTPMGRITNRMSKDMGSIDNILMGVLQMVIRATVGLLGMLIIIGINTSYVLVAFVPILAIFASIQSYFRSAAVQLKRIDAVTRSPIYAHFSECLGGMATIRAYGAQARMSVVNSQRLDLNLKIALLAGLSNRWLSIRLEFLGGLLILATAINVVIQKGSIDPSTAGVSLSYALQITTQLNMLIRVVTEVEGAFNAVERVQEYIGLEAEPAHEGPKPPENWPEKGKIELNNLFMSYVPGKPPVLRGLNLLIEPGEKVGVVGRTGAGKSSLFQALFRMMEPSSGTMKFDGVDLCKLGLDDVRNAISIIPQEPVLFAGTLRFNLDPFDEYTDVQLWDALDKASLKKLLITKGESLNMDILEGGENFSVGQRQLVCLSRALLKKSKILVLDEATANVDLETDALIQHTIRDNFSDRTTLTIAHRLNTIIDCDKILVLDIGQVLEYDSPKNLLSRDSEFASMVHDTGPENEASLRAAALGEITPVLQAQKEENKRLAEIALHRNDKGEAMVWGNLMSSYRQASNIMRSAWDDRHNNNWESELSSRDVSISVWLRKMTELLSQVNSSAEQALDNEHIEHAPFGLGIFNQDRTHGNDDQIKKE